MGNHRRYIGIRLISPLLTITEEHFLFLGYYSKISNGRMPNELDNDYLEVSGSVGSESYTCPNTQAYLDADSSDYVWFKTDGERRSATTVDLQAWDFEGTVVKYGDTYPNQISIIAILKQGYSLSEEELNILFESFELPTLWNNSINSYSHLKDKDMIGIGLGLIWGQNTRLPDVSTIPYVTTAVITDTVNTKVVITFDNALKEDSVPAPAAFTIAGKTITNVAVSGFTCTLTVSVAWDSTDVVTVSYTVPGSNQLKAAATNAKTLSFADQVVTNNAYALEAVSLITRMTAAGSTPDSTRRALINTTIKAAKLKAFWAKLDFLYTFAAHADSCAVLNWKSASYTCSKTSTPTFATDRGYTGNGSTYRLSSGFNPSTAGGNWTQNSATIGAYVRTTNVNDEVEVGGTSTVTYIKTRAGGAAQFKINCTTNAAVASATAVGLSTLSRTSSNVSKYYKGASATYNGTESSTGIENTSICFLATGEASPVYHSTKQVALAFGGGGFTATDVSDFNTIFVTGYLTTIGANA
jgi:hypothetical protein